MGDRRSRYSRQYPNSATRLSVTRFGQLPNELVNLIQYFVEAPRRTRQMITTAGDRYMDVFEPVRSDVYYRSDRREDTRHALRQWSNKTVTVLGRLFNADRVRRGLAWFTPSELRGALQQHRSALREHPDTSRAMVADYGFMRDDIRQRYRSYQRERYATETEAEYTAEMAMEVNESMGYHHLRMIFERVRIILKRLVLRRRQA